MTDAIKGPSQQEPQPSVSDSSQPKKVLFGQNGQPISSAIATDVKNIRGGVSVERFPIQSDRKDHFSIPEDRVNELITMVVQSSTTAAFSYVPSVQDIVEALSTQPQEVKSKVWQAIATITLQNRKESGDSTKMAKELQQLAERGEYHRLDISPEAILDVMKRMLSDPHVRHEFTNYQKTL